MSTIQFVHCIDAEGPLRETYWATMERLWARGLPRTVSSLADVQRGQYGADLADFVAPRRLAYLETWDAVQAMLARVTSPAFRARYADPQGTPYRYAWFIAENGPWKNNPRRKAVGRHEVYDHIMPFVHPELDTVGFHYHLPHPSGDALRDTSSFSNIGMMEEVLCRRLLDRDHFPLMFRAGGAIMRPDRQHWASQFFPLDYSRMSPSGGPGELMDWRHASDTWAGNWYSRRCIEFDSINATLTPAHLHEAFKLAPLHERSVVAYADHDRRDIEPDVQTAYAMIQDIASTYPSVTWTWGRAVPDAAPPQISLSVRNGLLWISGPTQFNQSPFLAVREVNDLVYRDNPTKEDTAMWAYRLHPDMEHIAVAHIVPGNVSTAHWRKTP